MKVLVAAVSLYLASFASANPFAPKVTKNTAKANYIGRLMSKASSTENSQLRKLEEEQEVDISGYSIKFEQCQFVKQYNGGDGGKNKDGADTILAMKRFVIFRLCPDNSCNSCNYNYGEYVVDLDTYLEATLKFKEEEQENYCKACEECANEEAEEEVAEEEEAEEEVAQEEVAEEEVAEEEAAEEEQAEEGGERRRRKLVNVDCGTCYDECQSIENLEENGYVDASQYTGCQKLNEDENGQVFYAGPMCASSGSRIMIGVFLDEECSVLDSSADIEDYMVNNDGNSMKLSYHLLKKTFAEGECVANCLKEDENANNNDGEQKVEINEVCGQLYEAAGKCESSHGFESGIENYDNYDNQVAQEELVCNFISSMKAGTYDETGEIVLKGGRSTFGGGITTTGGQKFALTFFILGSLGLAGYAAMLHSHLTKGGVKADLSQQGEGAMA